MKDKAKIIYDAMTDLFEICAFDECNAINGEFNTPVGIVKCHFEFKLVREGNDERSHKSDH